MTVKGGTSPACAVCKFQRRRCSPDCMLAPHFPANQMKVFQSVHRLFGVSNIVKTLKQLNDDDQCHEAMKSIKYESYIRQIFPVDGCLGVICHLEQQLAVSTRELEFVRAQLAYRQIKNSSPDHSTSSHLQLGTSNTIPSLNENIHVLNYHFAESEIDFSETSDYLATKPLMLLQNCYDEMRDHAHSLSSTRSFTIDGRGDEQFFEGYSDIPFTNLVDDKRSCCESSSDSSLKDATPRLIMEG